MKRFVSIGYGGLLLMLLLQLGGCGQSQQETTGGIVTDQQRRGLPARAAQMLFTAQDAFQERNYRAALALADSVEQYDPDLTDLHFLRGRIYTALGALDSAKKEYRTVLSLDPGYQGVRYNMGNNFLREGKNRQALGMYHQEQARFPSANTFLQMGRAYNNLGIADSAVWAFQQAIATDSANASAYMWLAQLYEDEGEFEQALRYSQKGLDLEPDNVQYQYLVGAEFFRSGNPKEAVRYLEPVVRKHPGHFEANYNLGRALVALGQKDRGKRLLAKADSLQKLDKEIEELRSLARMKGDDFMSWVQLGEKLQQAGRPAEALEAYDLAKYIQPWNLPLRNNIAIAETMNGDTARAIAQYRAILRRDSTLADVWFNLGVTYANIGHEEQARNAWSRVVRLQPENQQVRAYLAKLNLE